MNVTESNHTIYNVLSQKKCRNSSEFVLATYEIYKKIYPEYSAHIEPVTFIEKDNEEKEFWANNCVHAEFVIRTMNLQELQEVQKGYRAVLDFLLNDDTTAPFFPMDKSDTTGWKIWKELDAKYQYTVERIRIASHDRTKVSN